MFKIGLVGPKTYSAVQKSSDTRLRDEKRVDLVAFLKRNLKFFLP